MAQKKKKKYVEGMRSMGSRGVTIRMHLYKQKKDTDQGQMNATTCMRDAWN